jgi:TolB-like protein
MASGSRPFQGKSGFDLSSAILTRAPAPLPLEVPAELGAVIGRCLEKDPAKRYQKAQDVRTALDAIRLGTASTWASWRYRLTRHRWLVPAAGALVAAALLFALDLGGLKTLLTGGPDAEGRAFKLAVLPFVNLTGDPEQEFLNDGLTQEMITLLGRLHPRRLGVIARTSVMRYKKAETPIDQIGRELGVDYVLEGSARREGGRVRVSADLIQVRDQTQLWGDVFEREMSDILALQNEVAGNIAKTLALKLLPSEQARLAQARPVNPEAYEACLKARSYWHKLTPPDLDASQRYFELALEKDPAYVPAYLGLSWVWAARQQMGIRRAHEVRLEWKKAALRAVELDDNSSEGHLALASFLTWGEWDWEAAWPEWKRAVELNPNNADTLTWYSHFLTNVGRIDEALPPIERALELDPFNPVYYSMYAGVLNYHGRYEEAAAAARKALALQPDAPVAWDQLTLALEGLGRKDERLAAQRDWIARDSERMAAFERGLAKGGYEGALRGDADVLAARYAKGTDRSGAVGIAALYRGAGDKDRSIDWLEKAFEDHDGNLPYIGRKIWAPLRSDPRFQELLRKLKLPAGDRK